MRYELNLIGLLAVLLISCGGSGTDPEPEPPAVIPPPSAATLIFPDNNTECNEGVVISATQSRVEFQWNNAQNADSYELNVTNLNTNVTSRSNSNSNSAAVTILRGTPYEWFVVSRASGTSETATSASWRFYNQGPGIENYAPFPAEVVSPARGATLTVSGTVNLVWAGSDVDNDILEYEVYLGTNDPPVSSLGTTTESTFEAAVNNGTVYYWRIITRDSQGNSSSSEIFEFKTL